MYVAHMDRHERCPVMSCHAVTYTAMNVNYNANHSRRCVPFELCLPTLMSVLCPSLGVCKQELCAST